MQKFVVTVVWVLMLSGGCATTTPSVSLKDVTTQRVYTVDKTKLLDAMRLFCPKYDFVLKGIEPETGRVRAFKKMETLRQEETRTILMLVYIIRLHDGRSRVEAKFVYDKIEGTPTRQEESQLVDCYTSLFNYLDREVQ